MPDNNRNNKGSGHNVGESPKIKGDPDMISTNLQNDKGSRHDVEEPLKRKGESSAMQESR